MTRELVKAFATLMIKRPDRGPAPGRFRALVRRTRDVAASLGFRRGARRGHALRLVQSSGLFDREWYVSAYPDVARARIDPLNHYMNTGWREGRDPGPDFATSSYLKANPDVAAAGANPLLHFLEFGQSEGRGPTTYRAAPRPPKVRAEFGPAAPCASFPLLDEPPVRWLRSYRLRPGGDLFSAGGCVAGYAADPTLRSALNSDFALLASLSGYAKTAQGAERAGLPRSAETLADAWYVNSSQLRTRWNGADFPVAVRAFQHDPLCEGELRLVGEGLAASPLDIVDFHLSNPLFPVLILFATADGAVRGTRMLAFPSLCRGGLHYAELLHSTADSETGIDPLATGELLAARLLRLHEISATPAVGRIEVDMRGADARGPLFQPGVQQWLSKLFRIAVSAAGVADGQTAGYLADAVAVCSPGDRHGGATLCIGQDMVPTIAALVEPDAPGSGNARHSFVPLIVAFPDPSEPAIAIELPAAVLPAQGLLSGPATTRWPRVTAKDVAPDSFPAAAIAPSAGTPMSDSTLFVPISGREGQAKPRAAVTWLVDPSGWAEGGLAQAVLALSQQTGGGGDRLVFLGAPDPDADFAAASRFAGHATSFDTMQSAVAAAETPLVGFVGPGVLLHDNGSAAVLAALLDDDCVATASCAVIRTGQQSAGGHASLEDGGNFATPLGHVLGRPERHSAIAFLWGSNYPVAAPGRHLWLARKTTLTKWTEDEPRHLADGLHLFSSSVSVSHVGSTSPARVPDFIPRAPDERATRVRALFG